MKKAGVRKSKNKDFQFWMQHNHLVEMNANEIIASRIGYIHNNPIDSGFVNEPQFWKYRSAVDSSGEKRMVNLVFLIEDLNETLRPG